MVRQQIAVGLDGSLASRHALRWAVREAVRRGADVLVVTAVPSIVDGPVPDRLVAAYRMQRVAIVAARAAVPGTDDLLVGRQVLVGDPVTALCHAAAAADLLVLGSDESSGLPDTSIPGRVARRLAARRARGGRCPLVVIPTAAAERPLPAGVAALGRHPVTAGRLT